MYIFSKIQLFEVQPCADPESYVRGWRADNGPTLNAGFVAFFCDFSRGGGSGPPAPLWIRPLLPRISAKSTLPKPAGT